MIWDRLGDVLRIIVKSSCSWVSLNPVKGVECSTGKLRVNEIYVLQVDI